MSEPLLRVQDLHKTYRLPGGRALAAVAGVSFTLDAGETLGLVGESGCGKSSLARCIVRLQTPGAGRILLNGTEITTLPPAALRPHRRTMQLVFQDPITSLDPRMRAGDIVAEPLRNYGLAASDARIAELFAQVGLRSDQMRAFPHQLSGGQRQRLGIARALALQPSLIVLDEPVSALDVSVQAQVINLLVDLQARLGVAYLFVAHDLGVVAHVSHRVAVMYLGRIVELASRDQVFSTPAHPYTRALLAAAPQPDPTAPRIVPPVGEPPSRIAPPSGCAFHTRCPSAMPHCAQQTPSLRDIGEGRLVACHLA